MSYFPLRARFESPSARGSARRLVQPRVERLEDRTVPAIFPAQLDLSGLNGANGFSLFGAANGDEAGRTVAGAGDVNGDGLADLIIGAPYAAAGGRAYVVFGTTDGFSAGINLGSLNGQNGFILNGDADGVGFAVAGAGDFNGDGLDDLLIGAPYAGGSNRGQAYVVFGRTSFTLFNFLSGLDGSNGFSLNGAANNDHAGFAVAGAGDVNGDGLDDVIIGAPFERNPSVILFPGQAHVVFGRTSFGATLNLSSLNSSNGFTLSGTAAGVADGFAVAGAGDVNGDGLDDLIVGAPFADAGGTYRGRVYVVFGRTVFTSPIDLSGLSEPDGLILNGEADGDHAGIAVAGVGDVNGDGLADLIVGAPFADAGGTDRGQAYVIYGRCPLIAVGPDKGAAGHVKVFRPSDGPDAGTAPDLLFQFLAYPVTFTGGVRVAVGDVNGDGQPDILVAPGPGLPGQVRVIDGHTRKDLLTRPDGFFPFGEHFTSGIYVATGDVNNDGKADLIVSPQKGPRPVKAYDAVGNLLLMFFPYGAGFTGPVRVAAGQLLGDATAEIVTSRGAGVSQVKVWDMANLTAPVRTFKAFTAAGGNFVAVGNVDGDAQLEVIVGAEGLQPPRVRWFDVSPLTPVQEGQLTAYAPNSFHGGVRVSVLPGLTGPNRGAILTAPGKGQAALVKRFDALDPLTALDMFFAYDQDFTGGAFVAGG